MKCTLSQTFYFDAKECVPDGLAFSKVIESLSFWGDRSINGYLWQDSSPPSRPQKIRLGSANILKELALNPNQPVWGGVDCGAGFDRVSESRIADLSFGCYEPSSWLGVATPAYSSLVLSEDWYNECGFDLASSPFKVHASVMDRASPIYGCLDVSSAADSQAGLVFGSLVVRGASLRLLIEQARWLEKLNTGETAVRGLFWGNYFGHQIVEALNQQFENGFVEAYSQQAKFSDGSPSAIIEEFANGVFLSIGNSPLECVPGNRLELATQLNVAWLTNSLVRGKLL